MPERDNKPVRLLLIEDDEDDSILIRGLLSEIDSVRYDIHWVSTYEDALRELNKSDSYDVCLLDYRLGMRDGLEILQQTSWLHDRPPIIVLTGQGDYDIDMEAMRSGAADYLVKGQIDERTLERSLRYAMERKKSQDALRESEKELSHLSSQLLVVQENERRKIAAELHDNLGQNLTAIKFKIESFLALSNKVGASDFESVVPMIQEAVEQVRNIYTQLRPSLLDDFGVTATISWYCRELGDTHQGIRLAREVMVPEEEIPDGLKLVIFRIFQDAMDNILTHSRADRAWVLLEKRNGKLWLEVKDNGSGFDVRQASPECGLGLLAMKKRAELSGGALNIESEIGKGTLIQVWWPVVNL